MQRKRLICTLIALVMLVGCTKKTIQPPLQPISLKVMHNMGKSEFYEEYGKYADLKGLQITFDVIARMNTDKEGGIENVVKKYYPDVLLLTLQEYKTLLDKGELVDLEPLIKRDNFDIENMLPSVIDFIRQQAGDRKLYGLTSSFSNQAVFYNKDLFQTYKLMLPTDQMTWKETLSIASQFKPIKGVSGLSVRTTPYHLISQIADTERLKEVDVKQKKAFVHTKPWKEIVELVWDHYRAGNIIFNPFQQSLDSKRILRYSPKDEKKIFGEKPFEAGKAAMHLDRFFYVNELEHSHEKTKVNWDVVTSPVSAHNRYQSSTYSVKNIYAISKHTQYIDRAWSLLQLINGAEVAKGKLRQSRNLLVRAPYVHEKLSTGRNMAAFYSLSPREYEYSAQMPAQADMTFREKKYEIMNSAIESIFTGEKEIDVALQEASQKLEQVMHDHY